MEVTVAPGNYHNFVAINAKQKFGVGLKDG